MLICDRCQEPTTNSTGEIGRYTIALLPIGNGKAIETAVNLIESPGLDLCERCTRELKIDIKRLTEPLPKVAARPKRAD